MDANQLSEDQKNQLRKVIVLEAERCLDVPYELGAEWTELGKIPQKLDCSELVEGVYKLAQLKIPDGSQNQFNFTVPTTHPKFGDLAFFGKGNGNPKRIYHVGILFDEQNIIEARAFDGRVWTGKVLLRQRHFWEGWKNFAGYRAHPKLV